VPRSIGPVALSSRTLATDFNTMANIVQRFFSEARASEKPPLSSASSDV
jgi:hypothetical protein